MLDEREERSLEAQVDALRTKEKDSESRKTYDQVFDHPALMCLAKLISAGVLSTLGFCLMDDSTSSVWRSCAEIGPKWRERFRKRFWR